MIQSLPMLRGTLAATGPWASMFARAGYKVYPYQLGCQLKLGASGTSTLTPDGLGQFATNDYVMICTETDYGDSSLFIPDLTRIAKVSAVGATTFTIDQVFNVDAGEYLLNLGTDTDTPSPTQTPAYDGTDITLYTDSVGNGANANKYLLTGTGGTYRGWTQSGRTLVDLLVTDSSGSAKIVIPYHHLGAEIFEVETLTADSATPSVATGRFFKTANSSATITTFTGGYITQEIRVLIADANTTLDFSGTTLKGNNGVDWTGAVGDTVNAWYDGTNWYCTISEATA